MEGLKVIRVELKEEFDFIEIIPIADVHYGDFWTDEKAVEKAFDYVLEKPNRFIILNGDLINNGIKTSKTNIYAEKLTPSNQLDRAKRRLIRVKDRILAMGTGNHEERTALEVNIDMSYLLARELGIEDRYADNSFILFVKFGKSDNWRPLKPKKNVYSMFIWHGSGGGKKSGGKLNNTMEMLRTAVVDIYIMSHVHDPILKPDKIFQDDISNMSVYERSLYYMTTNAWQDFGGYGQKFGYSPVSKDMTSIILNGNGKKKCKLISGNNEF